MLRKYYNFFLCISNIGIMTKQIARDYFSISKNTFYTFLNDNLIIKKGNFIIYGKVTSIYSLSDNSKKIMNSLGKILYRSNNSQLEHDYLLLKSYCNLPFHVQETWLNETELKSLYRCTTVDGLFLNKNNLYAVEVITPSYSKNIIEEKINFANKYCRDLIILNTMDVPIK